MKSSSRTAISWGLWAVALAALCAALPSAAVGQDTLTRPKIDPLVAERAQSDALVPVFIVLKHQPQAEIYQQAESASALSQRIADSGVARLAGQPLASLEELGKAQAAADAVTLDTRRQAFQAIEQAVGPEQDALKSRLAGLGATRISAYKGVNIITAEIPASAIAALEADPSIAEVFPAEMQYAQLATSVPALGAPAFWAAGYTGQGQSVGVLDTGVRTDHPAFTGKSLVSEVFLTYGSGDSCFGDDASSAQDLNGHGTHVTGIVMSQGSSGWTNYLGVAKGLGTLYNLKIGYNQLTTGSCTGGGQSDTRDVLAAIDWAVANTPLKVLNYSFGAPASGDDDGFTRSFDQYADTYGLTIAIAAGNSGPGGTTVGSPGIAYNSITAANWSSSGAINDSSSRGPTIGGRYKPDLAAPGTNIFSAAFNWDSSSSTSDDFVAMTGTSMASPHLAGSAALLRSAGVSDPLAVKAILINTTDNTGWAADRGWGYTDLTSALGQLSYLTTGSLAGGAIRFYRVTPSGSWRATVAWNRHVSGSTSQLNNIDLRLYRPDTGALLSGANTPGQTVGQVAANYSGDAVMVLQMVSTLLSGVSSEPYGLALSGSVSPANGPAIASSCNVPSSILSGSQFTISCTATNNGDLTAFAATVTATLPDGFSGNPQLSLGDVQAGQTSSPGSLTLTATDVPGTFSIPLAVSSTSFGVLLSQTTVYQTTVAAALPAPVLSSPSNGATGVSTTPVLSWSASTGATSYDVYLGTTSPPPLAGNTASTSYSPVVMGGTQYYWRVAARTASGTNTSATWSFTTQLNAPVLTAPANGATGVSVTPTLTWNAVSGATSYDVYLGTVSPPSLVGNATTPSYPTGTLLGQTQYYWQVVAKNAHVSASSSTWSFTTQTGVPPAPALVSPTSYATGVSLTPTLIWNPSNGATSYDVYFGTAVPLPLVTNTAATSYSPGALADQTTYIWQVVAKNALGSTASGYAQFTTLHNGPTPPDLISPSYNATGVSTTPTLIWSAPTGATSYDVYLGTSSPPPLATSTTATAYSPGTLSAGTLYYWRVVAKSSAGTTTSPTNVFTTTAGSGPPAPTLVSPGNQSGGASTTPSLSWNASSGATSYDVYLGTSASPPLVANTTATSYTPAAISSGTQYYWRVVAKNASGSTSSIVWWFWTQIAAPVLASPPDGASGVSLTPVLSWSASTGAESYGVYLGTSTTSMAENGVTAGTTYSPAALNAGTQYYWRVGVVGAGGSNTSATSTFTTQTAAPALFSPGNGAVGVPLATSLNWIAAAGATSYDVYFGSSSPPPLLGNATGTTYSAPSLTPGTVYYWKVVARSGASSYSSAIWSFTAQIAAPLLTSPGNSATGVSDTPTLVWSAAAGATSYDVYLGTSSPPPLATSGTGITYAPGALIAGTIYYWRVLARNGADAQSSATWSFTTQAAGMTLLAPANGAAGVSLTPALSWSASTGVSSYDVYFGTSPSPPLATSTPGTSYAPGVLGQGTTYYWRVVARSGSDSNTSATWSFTTQTSPPAAPVLSAPANGAVAPSLTLSWSAASGAISYDVYFGTVSPPPLVTNTTDTTYTPAAVPAGTLCYWQVVARNPGGSSASATWSFTTGIAAPVLASPADGAIGVSLAPTLTWSAAPGATSYDVYFGTEVSPPLVTNTTATSFTPGTLSNGALYFWRVVARDSGGASGSDVWSFATPMAPQPAVALRFIPMAPCRIVDTRGPEGPFGGPSMAAGSLRSIAIPQSDCGIPATAQVYSLNATVVPKGRLSYLTLWPAGKPQPGVSTLNSFDGIVVANAAIVPAGAGGAVSVYVTDDTDVILDINGYFDSPSVAGSLAFYPAPPCRVADTRGATGPFGGPSLGSQQTRDFAIASGGCGIPSTASAYSMNATVVPKGYLGFLTAWPAGQSQANVSTVNSWTGKVVANAALVPAGANEAISVYASDPTDLVLDINGYFGAPGAAGGLSFYPVAPCRVADTRGAGGPFGGPEMAAAEARSFPIPSGGCNIPSTAAAYSLNVTVVPEGMLSYLTAWPTGSPQPLVSTLNSFDGAVVANAAIVPAGADGAISIYTTNPTHVILDIDGYFAP